MRIYFDACCLSRPFDDQSQERIHLETEAIETILAYVESGVWHGVYGDILKFEVMLDPNAERRFRVLSLMEAFHEVLCVTDEDYTRAEALVKLGIKALDALHLACAERAKADVFLTTDDRLLKVAGRKVGVFKVIVSNPMQWIVEQL